MENDFQKIIHPCFICGQNNFAFAFKKNGYNLWRCKNCSLIFVFPREGAEKIYSADYFSAASLGHGYVDYDQDKLPMVPTFKKYLALLKKHNPNGGKLMDVGAATGFFVDLALQDGWQASGIEISDYAATLGRNKGLDILTGTLSKANLSQNAYSAITMFDVLEHFIQPVQEIAKVWQILNNGGILAINTPDAGSWLAKILGRFWHLFVPPEHLNYFNQKNLIEFLTAQGFEIVYLAKIGKSFTLEYIFKTLYAWQKLAIWNRLGKMCQAPWLNKLAIPINLRDNIFVLARKK
ncbi:MAG: class I SAM-dependent methyltransferase [Patescibacteria group bacterium]|jgi:2-polyprenyl-3-methyl-5-hydroxy-6-metoxy-1,4-benzoquinol methylase